MIARANDVKVRFARAHGIANGRFSALAGDNVKGELWLFFNQVWKMT